ncbi:DEAD/DEAH box helicase [Methanosphaerula subterraneus]|uniref:DEAD/DEAH box helicase n=1 Tax=Methanosphaerula subterraneus TaxID=3350244 RepID=UPI003F8612A8
MTPFIQHPLIRTESLESREYQLAITVHALEQNTMVVLPTGLGKTAIALLVTASRLLNHQGKVLVMAPTRPLVEQHFRFFSKFLQTKGGEPFPAVLFTGDTPPAERKAGWEQATLCFATPQVIKNDCIAGRYSLADVTLLIVDECHRAVGNYAYGFITERYLETARRPLVLAMTASPGGDQEKVREVQQTLGITCIESRVEQDPDVKPYVHERSLDYVSVALPDELKTARDRINQLLDDRLDTLRELKFMVPPRERLSMRELHGLNAQIQTRIGERDSAGFAAASLYAELMKLRHALTLAEAQGSMALTAFLEKIALEGMSGSGSKASRHLAEEPAFQDLLERCRSFPGEVHPKVGIVGELVQKQLLEHPESRIIVFATFRDTVQQLVNHLADIGIESERFVGQAKKDAEKGLTQKKQIAALQRFRDGEFRVLIATSVGEEGLDVPSTDLVIFYEAVPSEIRSIQRKGRTGRSGEGSIIVLVTRGTQDETFRYVSQAREKSMRAGMKAIRAHQAATPAVPQALPPAVHSPVGQGSLDQYLENGPAITVDDRETSSQVAEVLSRLGAAITLTRLEYGDYAIGDRILVERKTAQDFVDTLVDRDLLGQLREMAGVAIRPVLIIEGGDLYTKRDIHPNAIRGTLAAIAIDMGISILYTASASETAEMLFVLARREEGGRGERSVHHRKSFKSVKEQQEYVVAAFPDIGLKNARLLLDHCGSVRAVVNANEEVLSSIKGIGEKTAQRIVELASRQYEP